jgi:hypothetical protein
MKKLKEMWNNGKAWLCGVSAELYLLSQGAGNANASSDTPNVLDYAKDAVENMTPQQGFIIGAGILTSTGLYTAGKGFGEHPATCALGGGILGAGSIEVAAICYGWKGGVAAAALEVASFGAGVLRGRRQGNQINQQRAIDNQR